MRYYPREFFALSYRYARRISEVTGMPVEEALRQYTRLYAAFGLGRSFDPATPGWVEFVTGLARAADPVAWIDQTYLRLTGGVPRAKADQPFGAFSYELKEGGRVRLHFWGTGSGPSPLSRGQVPARLADLRALFAHVRQHQAGARAVVGGSWLYNIEAYRRLFPPTFLATAVPEETQAQEIALWGQFLDRRRQLKPEIAACFLDAVARQTTLDGLLHAFPYPVLRLEGPIEAFYRFYGVE